jgi:hypothetical protein
VSSGNTHTAAHLLLIATTTVATIASISSLEDYCE